MISSTPRKLILKNNWAPGDIVMLTAAVRDLHRCYPGKFLTDVRTGSMALWENNPHLTPLQEADPTVEIVECDYPLIHKSNHIPYHCLHGFIQFLNARLNLKIEPTLFKGDIHLADEEKNWCSQVHELTGSDTRFWIVSAGGKYDLTVKWWSTERYQEVVDHFRGRIQFVQVGARGDHHPKLKGVIDLRGETDLRQLLRLVYHSEGVLCGVTSLMHLAAAVEVKHNAPIHRPCVVIAGAREPAHWEAYPHHQYIHTNGALSCGLNGGCWRSRTVALGDGDYRDKKKYLCKTVVEGLPGCMNLIGSAEVCRRIGFYFDGGSARYLSTSEAKMARRGIRATAQSWYDSDSLSSYNAPIRAVQFIREMPGYPNRFHGRGIVICGGGGIYFTCAWVCIRMLRFHGCDLPIELWHLKGELNDAMAELVSPYGVTCIDASKLEEKFPARRLGGWPLKSYAILHSGFREVLLLDADNVVVRDPEYLFDAPQYRKHGSIFWPDYGRLAPRRSAWKVCKVKYRNEPEFESGQIVIDKQRCWHPLLLSRWYNDHSDFFYRHMHGDKETFHMAFRKLEVEYAMPARPIHPLRATMCQHDFQGRRVFQHRNCAKWNVVENRRIPGFKFERECLGFVDELKVLWDGGISLYQQKHRPRIRSVVPQLEIRMVSCAERARVRSQTLKNLRICDWKGHPVHVEVDDGVSDDHHTRQVGAFHRALQAGCEGSAEYTLLIEDDLEFNDHLRHNLLRWEPLRRREITLASIYNPNVRILAQSPSHPFSIVDAHSIYGSQAFLLSKRAIRFILKHWDEVEGLQDIKISRLASRLNAPIYYHRPSLVQHVGKKSVWGGRYHYAPDFSWDWRASDNP